MLKFVKIQIGSSLQTCSLLILVALGHAAAATEWLLLTAPVENAVCVASVLHSLAVDIRGLLQHWHASKLLLSCSQPAV